MLFFCIRQRPNVKEFQHPFSVDIEEYPIRLLGPYSVAHTRHISAQHHFAFDDGDALIICPAM